MTEAPDAYPEFPDDETAEFDDQGVEGRVSGDVSGERVRTGDARVDTVLASLDGLDDRPVSEHAVVFEQAHEQLRAALEPDRESA
jgi:hypothetical protein